MAGIVFMKILHFGVKGRFFHSYARSMKGNCIVLIGLMLSHAQFKLTYIFISCYVKLAITFNMYQYRMIFVLPACLFICILRYFIEFALSVANFNLCSNF